MIIRKIRIYYAYMRKSVLDALFSKIRQDVLGAFMLFPEKWWYLSDLAKHLGVTPSSIQKELASLSGFGVLETRKDGNRTYYRPDKNCSIYSDLQSLLIKTSGIVDVVRAVVTLEEIELAFIFGSMATGGDVSESDVDIFIIGDLSLEKLAPAIRKAEKKLQRELNLMIFSREEVVSKVKAKNSFLLTVLKDKKIFLKGSEDGLRSLA